MKKILHISKYYYPFSGGTEQIARDCVLALKNRYEQKVIAFNDGKEDRVEETDGVEVIKCGCFAKVASQSLSFSYARQLKKVINEFCPDIIIFHCPNPFVAAILLRALKGKEKIRLVVYWHLDIIKQKFLRNFFKPQNRKLIKRADKIIATSPNYIEGSEWLSMAREKCIVIPNCINIERMEITPDIKDRAREIKEKNVGRTICVAVGRHTEYKGFKYLIQASHMLPDQFRFYITGTGELTKELHEEAAGDQKITFTGRVEDDELKALILAADIFCFPSITKNEAFGVALAEAMYYEKPAVTFTIPGSGVNYVCLNGENGIEVENRNVEEYAKALQRLAKDDELRAQYGRAGKKRVMDHFLSTQYSENIRKLLEQL